MLQQTNPRTLRLLDFAEFIETLPDERINIWSWHTPHPCHTVACYAGHAIYKYGTTLQIEALESTHRVDSAPLYMAMDLLKISHQHAGKLFLNMNLTKQAAIALLRQWAFEEPQT